LIGPPRLAILVLLCTVACERHLPPSPGPADFATRFSDITRAHLDADSVPGAVFIVVGLNSSSFGGTAGFADVERRIPMTDTTLLNIASVSKPLTALLVLRLAGVDVDSASVRRVKVEIPGVDTHGASYGFGHFIVRNAQGDTILFHSGGNRGAVAYLAVNRTRRTGIFVAANSERGIALVRALVAEWGRVGHFDPPPVF
jgi:hypothetical protein